MAITRHGLVVLAAALVAIGCGGGGAAQTGTAKAETESGAADAAPPARRVRQPVDMVGYTHTAEGIGAVIDLALENEKHRFAENAQAKGVTPDDTFAGAISPHDDYRYAAPVYVHVFPHIRAKHVVVVGVAHKARDFPEVEGKLVFDSFDAWRGPHGDVPVSPLREDLLAGLEPTDAIVHDGLHTVEHSVEGLLPFLQHFDRGVEILPVLVPYMSFERLDELSARVAAVLGAAMERRGLALGEGVAVLISSDSVHYGDEGWGDKRFDDFGVDQEGYDLAVARDLALIEDHLVGGIEMSRLESLSRALVRDDFHEYRVTWCGRFSIPFGLALLHRLPHPPGRLPPRGILLRYGTTLDPGPIDPGVPGLGFTAPASLRHWVGFAAVGYY